ncbi:TetR/AcrR family transcriptional regulator [Brevibacillus composti]|uniref:TetR/AcrR family transcriptional regulator n=1 Tax=Brevibacillus composti TaxID=2796470 RepID=A0A7T5EJR9_9BACL|nr:TetR/AcrR family transcriptional regulator [Brevibacillus composti]QQE73909.1 TetR/AcrR family transcriptional regulator [Brevibacillus composti]QUO40994.1 TetR/AcrR family transcriptional regulator [Brevibacillus composti]
MARKQEQRSEETKHSILQAAGQLFRERGYDAVTMREIAKAAGCSHTTIYIYFKDKEALLHQLSMAPLQDLFAEMQACLQDPSLPVDEKLFSTSWSFLRFCLKNRSMYALFFMTKSSRVDEKEPAMELQKLRNEMFGLLKEAVIAALPAPLTEEQAWAFARVYFFTLHGIIGTYAETEEPYEQLIERVGPTFELALRVSLAGCKQIAQEGDGSK